MNLEELNFIVLFGKTGCGKSSILRHLATNGMQVLHLEDLAGHSGSAFGGLEGKEQPDQEIFEQEIYKCLEGFDKTKPLWVEYESNYLGKLQLPEQLFSRIRQSEMLIIHLERDLRIRRIIEEYAQFGIDRLLEAALKLKKKISSKKYRLLRKSIETEDYETAVSILLTYYDRAYVNGMMNGEFKVMGELQLLSGNAEENAMQIIDFNKDLLKSRNPV
jgi:tRNA 2-selenouridine synthase